MEVDNYLDSNNGCHSISNKERMTLPFQKMELRNGEERVNNFEEVPIGYSDGQAKTEAMRCLQCKTPHCMEGCPVGIDIPGFIKLIAEENPIGAARKIRETSQRN